MQRLILVFSLLLLVSCGGGGDGDTNYYTGDGVSSSSSSSAPSVSTSSITCEHDGMVYICNPSCVPDTTQEVVAEEDGAVKTISIGGSVTIIAECGSNVDFNLADTTNTTTTTFSSSAGGTL